MTEKTNILKKVETITTEAEEKKKEIKNTVDEKIDKKMDDLQRVVDGLDVPPSVPGPMDNISINETEYISNVAKNIKEYIESEE